MTQAVKPLTEKQWDRYLETGEAPSRTFYSWHYESWDADGDIVETDDLESPEQFLRLQPDDHEVRFTLGVMEAECECAWDSRTEIAWVEDEIHTIHNLEDGVENLPRAFRKQAQAYLDAGHPAVIESTSN
jgi:hypothetical protein